MKKWIYGFALGWMVILVFTALAAPFSWAERAAAMDFRHLLAPPSLSHPMGTDALGRDLLARVGCGASVSLGVSALAVSVALLIGVAVGTVAGYRGGLVDRGLMALVDIFLCFPTFFLILAVVTVMGPGLWKVMFVIGLTNWMGAARLVRAEVLTLKEREFVLASRILGAGPVWVMTRHLIPNAIGPVITNAVLSFAAAILVETGLSFLGLGVQPPIPSWGNILMDGKATLGVAWWLTVFPGLMIFLTVFSVNILAEEWRRKVQDDSGS